MSQPRIRRREPRPRTGGGPGATRDREADGGAARALPATATAPWPWSAGLALAVLVVYLLQCPPVSGDKDSSEFALVLAFNGVAHPTGYPVYTLLGHLFVNAVHALGVPWAYAANAFSAVGGALAMYFLHRLGLRLVPRAPAPGRPARFLLALLPVLWFAFNPIWTYETALAEVYSWHVAWVLGTALYFAWLCQGLLDPRGWSVGRLRRHAALWGFLCGIGGAHHATAIFVAAPLSLALLGALAARRRLRLDLVLLVLASALVPLLSYGILAWRAVHPARVQWPVLAPGMKGLLDHITGHQYAHNLGRFAPSPEQVKLLAWYVWPFLVPGLVLLPAAAVAARGTGQRIVLWSLCVAALLGTAYGFYYGVTDPSSYFLYPMALGLVTLAPLGAALLGAGARARLVALGVGAGLGLGALGLWVPWLQTGMRRIQMYVKFDRYVHAMWESIPMERGFVFWTNDMYYKLVEFQMLDHEKPGLEVQHALSLLTSRRRQEFIRRHGFDPGQDVNLHVTFPLVPASYDSLNRQATEQVESAVNLRSPLPVIHFDPQFATVRLLKKLPPDSAAAVLRAMKPGLPLPPP